MAVSERNFWLVKQQGLAGDSMNDALTKILQKAGIIQDPKWSESKKTKNPEGAQPDQHERQLRRTPKQEPGNVNP